MSANLTHASDVLQKTTYAAPFDGMISAHLRDVTFSRIFLCLSLRHSRLRLRQSRVCGLPRRMAAVVLRFGDQGFFIKSFRPIPIKLLEIGRASCRERV